MALDGTGRSFSFRPTKNNSARKFKEIRKSVLRPALQQFVDYLGNKERAAEILEEEEKFEGGRSNQGSVSPPSITLLISPDSNPPERYGAYGQSPHFQIILEQAKSTVWFHESTMMPGRGGQAGKCGEADLDKLTSDLLEPFVAQTISKIFG